MSPPERAGHGASVLVIDQTFQTLAVVRSLARAGYRVILGRGRGRGEAERSRCCAEVWMHPPVEDPAFASALDDFLGRRADVSCVFPVGEASIAALGRCRLGLTRKVDFAMVPAELFEACRDKRIADELATAAGIPVPESRTVRDVSELRGFIAELGLPVIVKPIRSTRPIFGRKAYVVATGAECARFDDWPAEHDEVLVQRYITGAVEQCDFVAVDGELVAFFQAHALRTDRPDGTGYAVDFLSDPIDVGVFDACRSFAHANRYTGPGLLQLIRSDTDGVLYFLENNPRISAGIGHTVRCGLDMPRLTLEAARCPRVPFARVSPESPPYRVGYRTHWLSRDLSGLAGMWRELSGRERARWLRAIIDAAIRADDHMTWDPRDPMPTLWIYARLIRGVMRRGVV